jgi:hypothetical protein
VTETKVEDLIPASDLFPQPTETRNTGNLKSGLRAFHGGPCKNTIFGNFNFFLILTPNLISKVLYYFKYGT